jgi:co-chaperonin GroES (HSP10)
MEVVNGSLRMRGDRILVRPMDWEPSRIICAIRRGDPVKGRIVAVGPGRHPVSKRVPSRDGKQVTIHFSKRFQPTEVKVGEVIHLGGLNIFDGEGYKFPKVVLNGEVLLICSERDVAGIEEEA